MQHVGPMHSLERMYDECARHVRVRSPNFDANSTVHWNIADGEWGTGRPASSALATACAGKLMKSRISERGHGNRFASLKGWSFRLIETRMSLRSVRQLRRLNSKYSVLVDDANLEPERFCKLALEPLCTSYSAQRDAQHKNCTLQACTFDANHSCKTER